MFGQLDNSYLCWDEHFPDSVEKFYLRLKSFHFIKNNEYDSPFASGETFFGWQFNPEAGLKLNKNICMEAGAFLPYEFGTGTQWNFFPTLRLRINHKSWEAIAGSLINGLSHRLSESLYEFENHLTGRQEYGLQIRYHSRYIFSDLWLDWRKKTFLNSNEREHFRAGYSGDFKLEKGKTSTRLIAQALAIHYGGQLDTSDAQSYSDFSFVTGIRLIVFTYNKLDIISDNRICFGYNQSDAFILGNTPKNCFALWHNIIIKHPFIELGFGLFRGSRYRYETGNPWMNSISFANSRNVLYFNNRNLILIRASFPFKIYQEIGGMFRADVIYDNNVGRFDYSMGLYLNLDKIIRLIK
jgi:hypothetical protein